ncbi:hypothetical protein F0P96_09440 [Hymenobacter busanensis]|uniref:Uncharacterized protein n=1 Tax=Hymenobacter busanensis TaxID=2607656 RepID=A0A7L5A2V1_9BACT|nr:hypothetical protein [Hymenobacter busanensis]KAA9333193.1 hypothetical protein F0P96_09440 [Hymenobacter busanensis]QHJ08130.1 hypothetical protein GUY19_12880 [Hymenobacter busanensis]
MTRYFLVVAASLLPLCSFGQTKTQPATEQLESQLTAEICQDFDKLNAAKPFVQLSQEEAMSTLQQSMMQVMMRHPDEVEQLLKASGSTTQAAMQDLGQRVAVKLVADCPAAMPLFMRLTNQPATAATAPPDLTVTAAERPLLEKMARSMCADLSTVTTPAQLASQPLQQKLHLIQQAKQRVLKTYAKEISSQYGPEILTDPARQNALGAKVGLLAGDHCASFADAFGTK